MTKKKTKAPKKKATRGRGRPKENDRARVKRVVSVTLTDELLEKAEAMKEFHGFGSIAYAVRKGFEWAPEMPPKGKR